MDSPAFDCFASNAAKVAIPKFQDKSGMPGTLQSGKLQRLVLEEEQIATSLSTFSKKDELSRFLLNNASVVVGDPGPAISSMTML